MCDRGQAAGNFRCRGQADCRAGRICKVKPKQIKTETGSSCKNSQGLPVFCMESVLSLEQAKKSLQPRHQGQAAGNSRCRGQADCRAGRIRKVKCKQIETNTGSSCKCSQGLPVLCMERISSLEQAKKVAATKTPRTSSRKFWMQRASQLPCRQNRQSKIQTNSNRNGQFLQAFAGVARF